MKDNDKNVLRMPEELIADMNAHLPGNLTIEDIQTLRRGKGFKAWFICSDAFMQTPIDEMLDLSIRSSNALKRVGYRTVGDLINGKQSLEELNKIRNCGAKSCAEIMGKLFFFQYSQVPQHKRTAYMNKILQLNGIYATY